MKILFTPLLFVCVSSFAQIANTILPDGGGEYVPEWPVNCISSQQYQEIEAACRKNAALYILPNTAQRSTNAVTVEWPLRQAAGFNDCSYYFISAHVDQDTAATTFEDYNCGSIAYDGHRGTDIALWPFPFYKMDNNQVEVIAAAPGTIVNKVDGNFDKNCAGNNLTANYMAIQHADSTIAIYYHMKKNSLTSKAIGQTVTTGEFLGIVGSSGSSTGPHLHFEVWNGYTVSKLNDPFAGSCNHLNSTSWWANQKPYTEPAVIKSTVSNSAPVFPACPATETPNDDSCIQSGSRVFSIYMRNETDSTTVNLRIINPNNTNYLTWVHNCTANHTASYWYWYKTLPAVSGTYTFEASYNGIICSKQFNINCTVTGADELYKMNVSHIYPNPNNGTFIAELETSGTLKQPEIEIYNVTGAIIYRNQMENTGNNIYRQEIKLNIPPGFYFYKIKDSEQFIASGKLMVE